MSTQVEEKPAKELTPHQRAAITRRAHGHVPYIPIEHVLEIDATPYIRTGYSDVDFVLPAYNPSSEWRY